MILMSYDEWIPGLGYGGWICHRAYLTEWFFFSLQSLNFGLLKKQKDIRKRGYRMKTFNCKNICK